MFRLDNIIFFLFRSFQLQMKIHIIHHRDWKKRWKTPHHVPTSSPTRSTSITREPIDHLSTKSLHNMRTRIYEFPNGKIGRNSFSRDQRAWILRIFFFNVDHGQTKIYETPHWSGDIEFLYIHNMSMKHFKRSSFFNAVQSFQMKFMDWFCI